MRVGSLLGIFAVLLIMTCSGPSSAWAVPLHPADGTTIGPVQISALAHPGLCWQAEGNGSGVTLEHCDHVIQGQQWSLTPDGVLMNGNGYCLEAIAGAALYIDFAAQCAGTPAQLWHYRSGHLTSPGAVAGTGTCAATAGPVVPGAEIVGSACSRPAPAAGAVSRWSIGYSAVTVAPGRGRGPVGGTFGASVTVANAASAQAAYGVTVTFTLPPGVTASTLRAASPGSAGAGPSGSGLRCNVRTLTCTGTLPAGASRPITLTGPVPAAALAGDSYPIRARASVAGTTQRSRTARTAAAALTLTVAPAAPQPRSPLPLIAAGAAILLLGGSLLILITRRRPPFRHHPPFRRHPPSRHRVPTGTRASVGTPAPADTHAPIGIFTPPEFPG